MPEVILREWERKDPSNEPHLIGRTLDDPRLAELAVRLGRTDALRVEEGRHGLHLSARQHVGVVQFGDLRIQIRPKVATTTLWTLLAYGLGVDDLPRHPPVDLALEGTLPDLLAAMLVLEAERLWKAGVAHGYVRRDEWLDTPRGRPDLATLSRHLPLTRAALPCTHHAFTADTLDNQLVLSGLLLAARLVHGVRLRALLHRAAQTWRLACEPVSATKARLDEADRERTRLTARYAAAHRLVRALVDRSGPDDELATGKARLGGTLWNMATLFERVLARFLEDHLPASYRLATQHHLPELYAVERGDHHHRAPDPRPDLVVWKEGAVLAVLDTKYRDLSVTTLPREILYQLSVYSLAFGGQGAVPAIVLYAVPSGDRPDVWFTLRVQEGADRSIVLRSVALDRLASVLREEDSAVEEALRLVRAEGRDGVTRRK